MAYGDNIQGAATDLDNAIGRVYELKDPAEQFTRFGKTGRWASFDKKIFKASRYCFPVYTVPVTGTRVSDYATARTSAFPAAQELNHKMLSWGYTQQAMFQHSCKVNILDARRLDGGKTAVYDLATRVVQEADADFADKANNAFHQDSTCSMATVGAKYNEDGTTYSAGQTDCFIKIASGSIAQFQPGMVLSIDGSGSYTVNDVIAAPQGITAITASLCPGIIVTKSATNCDAVSAGQAIRLSGEASGDNIWGLPFLFSTSNYYYDENGNVLTRTAKGNQWQLPYVFNYYDSANVTFDLDLHLRPLANLLPTALRKTRQMRTGEKGLGRYMVAIGPSDLINEATQEAQDSRRFTTVSAATMDAAKRRELFGDVGFDGVVWHSATLPAIAFEFDPAARPNKLDILDPESWHWLSDGESLGGVEWLPGTINKRWSPVDDNSGSNGKTFYIQAAMFAMALVYCDYPKGNVELQGLASSV